MRFQTEEGCCFAAEAQLRRSWGEVAKHLVAEHAEGVVALAVELQPRHRCLHLHFLDADSHNIRSEINTQRMKAKRVAEVSNYGK